MNAPSACPPAFRAAGFSLRGAAQAEACGSEWAGSGGAIRGRLIICIASAWDYDPTSKHHIMRILARENDVLWVNYHGTRRPSFGRSDVRDSLAALRRVTHGPRRVAPSIVQLTPLVIPGARNACLQRLHRRLLIGAIRRAIRAMWPKHTPPIQLWTFAPDVPYLVGAFNEERSVYYCVDEYRAFEGFDAARVETAERELIRRANVVVTTSQGLYESRRRERPDAVLVRHGVDFDHFAAAWRHPEPVPADLAEIPRPRFGYFGLVHHWVDRALLTEVARLRPGYSFVVLGDCKVDVSVLEKLPNVYLLGRRAYDTLPAYAAHLCAGLLLFARNRMTRDVNPVKMYEYLAAGLPVVSTPLPEARRFAGPILFANEAAGFARCCDQIVERPHRDRSTISRLVSHETWSAVVERLSALVMARGAPARVSASTSLPRSILTPTGADPSLAPAAAQLPISNAAHCV